jgi:epoxide hydrolase-like predicted phosphatase
MTARRGLLMDWGGVMTSSVFASFAAFSTAEGLAEDHVAQAFRHQPRATELLVELERGTMPTDVFERGLAEVLGIPDAHGLAERLFAGVRHDEKLLAAVRGFRATGIRTGLLSNSWGELTYDRVAFAELFDVLVISGEEGYRKPDAEIYEIAIRRMGLAPEELVFVDDLKGNLKPARALGVLTLFHEDADTTIAALEDAFGIKLPQNDDGAPGGAPSKRPSGRKR